MIKVEEMINAANQFTIGTWLVSADCFHPAWDQWIISCVTLAGEVDNKAPAKINDSMTHEVTVLAVDPSHPVKADWKEGDQGLHFLQPIDQVIQFTAENDAVARERIESVVDMVKEGELSPDSDYRRAWEITLDGRTSYK